jgi:hypothetical protein
VGRGAESGRRVLAGHQVTTRGARGVLLSTRSSDGGGYTSTQVNVEETFATHRALAALPATVHNVSGAGEALLSTRGESLEGNTRLSSAHVSSRAAGWVRGKGQPCLGITPAAKLHSTSLSHPL